METLTSAYERFLADLTHDVHAECASIETRPLPDHSALPEKVATYGPNPLDAGLAWAEYPVYDGDAPVALLRMGFREAGQIPKPDDPYISHALQELVVLLNLAGMQQQFSLPAIQACKRILAVTEEELQHIILDIHDGPVQKLFAASSQLELMQRRAEQLPNDVRAGFEPDLARVACLLQSSLNEIKNTLGSLRPPEFRRRPLVSVLNGLVMQHEMLTGMGVNLTVSGDVPQVSLPVKIALYRIFQEALSNAYRHAHVESLEVHLHGDSSGVTLEVVDSGLGFEPPMLEGPTGTEREEHIGLRGMRDRAQLVGGQIFLTSSPGSGTRVVVKVPADG